MPTILYPPTIDWGFLFQRPQQIMRQFAKHGWEVIYCNRHQKKGMPLEQVEENLFLCYDLPAFIHQRKEVDVFYTSWAKCADLAKVIPSKLVIYDRVDDFKEWENYEDYMLSLADLVLTTSQVLYNKTITHHDNVILVRNACDFDHFHTCKQVAPYANHLEKPIIGFSGALGKWVNKNIIDWIADNYTFVIVGAEFGIKAPQKAINLGIKPYMDLPRYYKMFDIGLIPFITNDRISLSANPIKMYEYLASGKPVLATDTPETRLFPGHVHIIDPSIDTKAFVEHILSEENEAKKLERMLIAKQNTWENRFKVIEGAINKML